MMMQALFKRRSLPLVVRLALTLLLITALSMVVQAGAFWWVVNTLETNRRIDDLEDQADLYAALAQELVAFNGNLLAATPIIVSQSVGQGDTAVRVFGSAGQIFGASGRAAPFPSRAAATQLNSSVPQVLLSEAPDRRYRARPITWNGRLLGVLEVSQSTDEEIRLALLLRQALLQSTVIAVIAAIFGALIVARWLAHLIGRVRRAAISIAEGDLQARAPERGPHELVELTQAVNSMADQLAERLQKIEAQAEAQQRFYRDVSHELRTPLMALGGYLENIEDVLPPDEQLSEIGSMQREIERLRRLADDLLRSESAPSFSLAPLQPVDLTQLIIDTVRNLQPRATRTAVTLNIEHDGAAVIQGDRDRLKQALINLLDNALRATPPGGSVTLATSHYHNTIIVDVSDTGYGIPPDLRNAVWERGVRGSEGGSGLGLAIVRAVVEAHGGVAELIPSEQGAHIRLSFPDNDLIQS